MKNSEKFTTAKERAEAFKRFCEKSQCYNCVLREQCNLNNTDVAFYWLDLEAPAEEPLPCPFCGKDVEAHNAVNDLSRMVVECTCCEYTTASFDSEYAAIAAHNRVARAAKEGK